MTSQVEVPPLTGLIHFFSSRLRVKAIALNKSVQIYIFLFLHENLTDSTVEKQENINTLRLEKYALSKIMEG